MGRLLAIDYGRRRCGIAVSDPMQIVAGALCTVSANELLNWIRTYTSKEDVERIIIGEPHNMDGTESESMRDIRPFVSRLRKAMPNMPIEMVDERFTTKIAFQTLLTAGVGKKARNNKSGLVDRVSATIILQTYMDMNQN